MAKVERTITINAPVEKVYAYITDPAKEVEFIPSITNIQNVSGEGIGQTYEWTYKMLGISLSGKSKTLEYKQNERYVSMSSGGITSTWTWLFNPEDGGTRVNLTIDYTIPVPVIGKFAERLVVRQTEREADLSVDTLKAILED